MAFKVLLFVALAAFSRASAASLAQCDCKTIKQGLVTNFRVLTNDLYSVGIVLGTECQCQRGCCQQVHRRAALKSSRTAAPLYLKPRTSTPSALL